MRKSVPRKPALSLRHPCEKITPLAREILHRLAVGFRQKEIADQLGITPDTLRSSLRHAVKTLGVLTVMTAACKAATFYASQPPPQFPPPPAMTENGRRNAKRNGGQ